jgi:hypothetical protein
VSRGQKQALERQQQERERQREFQADQQREQQALQQAFNQNGNLDRGWMREILETDDLEQYLNSYEIDKVRALINKQWVLANLSEAQTHDRWHKLDVMKLKVYGSFPPGETPIQGPARAFLLDDETEVLSSLTAEQRAVIDQIFTSLQNMVTRSTEGFERKQTNTSIARTETEQNSEDDGGDGLRGLFS